ncbi:MULTISPECIES: hypothetical protein [unclassified Frigoribacterium]|uniref:hypothetical protein n=1 Tax=unclassified Frigoribacterium TaxID=2627005 RepID=UPI000AA9B83E|nr:MULTISPECIES: hypothetical protein [unclassified Frigoribacterium]
MPEQSVADYAAKNGLSVRRVQAQAACGALPARRVAGRWLIDDSLEHRAVARRPLGLRMQRALSARLDDLDDGLTPTERVRLTRHLDELRSAADPADLIWAWFRPRRPLRLDGLPSDVADLPGDGRVVPSGFSDPRAGIAAAGMLEAHIGADDLDAVLDDFILEPSDRPTVLLHVDDVRPSDPVPLAVLLVDLAQGPGPRERAQVGRLVAEHLT